MPMDNGVVGKLILRIHEVSEVVGMSISTIKRKVRAGNFPKPKQLGERAIGWLYEDILEWVNNLNSA